MALLSAAQAAKALNISHAWIRRLCQDGRLKGEKVGQSWVISEKEIERFKKIPRPVGNPNLLTGTAASHRRRHVA